MSEVDRISKVQDLPIFPSHSHATVFVLRAHRAVPFWADQSLQKLIFMRIIFSHAFSSLSRIVLKYSNCSTKGIKRTHNLLTQIEKYREGYAHTHRLPQLLDGWLRNL